MTDELIALRAAVEQLTHVVLGKRLTRAEVCDRIGRDTHTLTRWVREKRFPPSIGGKWLLADVVEWERSKPLR